MTNIKIIVFWLLLQVVEWIAGAVTLLFIVLLITWALRVITLTL
jgi:hypothetical protein